MREAARKRLILLSFLAASFFFFTSHPQILAQNVPPGQEPGAEAERFRKESEQQKEGLKKKKLKAPEIEVQEEAAPQAAKEGLSFVLKEVKIRGSTVFKPEDFASIYEPYLNKEVTYKDLEVIVEGIKAKYKGKGYLTTTAYLPDQQIDEAGQGIQAL